MKVLITILTFIATRTLWEANANYIFTDIERYWTAMVTNDVMFTRNQTEYVQTLEYFKTIDTENPLFMNVTIRRKDNNKIAYEKNNMNVCNLLEDPSPWYFTAHRIFTRAMMPGVRKSKCPWVPRTCEIYRYQNELIVDTIDYAINSGKYDISYTVTWHDKPVFSTLKFTTTLLPLPPNIR